MNGIQECLKLEFAQNVNRPIGTEKKCSKCKQILPVKDFYKVSGNKDGLFGWCKICGKKQNDVWRAKNIEKARESSRIWFAKNTARAHENNRIWRIKNLEYDRERSHAWDVANPIRRWVLNTLNKHKKNGFDIRISLSELMEIAYRCVKCPYCETVLNWSIGNKGCGPRPNSPSLDRIYNSKIINKSSIQILCNRCNIIKGNEFGDTLRNRLLGMLRNIPYEPLQK